MSSSLSQLVRASLVASFLFLCAPAQAADEASDKVPKCDAKTEFGSEDWFLSKARCGADKLLEKGQDILADLALDLLGSAIDSYIPGLSSLLFGGGEDPMAAYVQKILDAIDDARHDIISAVLSNERDTTLKVDFNEIQEQLDSLGTIRSFANKLGKYQGGYYANLESTMNNVRQRLQNRENVFGLDSLHTLMTLVTLHVAVKPQVNYFAELTGRGVFADDLDEMTEEELADITQATADAAEAEVRTILSGGHGVLPYLERLGRDNKYRKYSDAAFGELDMSCIKWFAATMTHVEATCAVRYGVQDTRTIWNAKEQLGTRELIKDTHAIDMTCEQAVFRPAGDDSQLIGACTRVKYKLVLPDGAEHVRTQEVPCPNDGVTVCGHISDQLARELYQIHKDWAYRQALITAYAPIRGVIDEWYARVGQSPPVFDVDLDLESAVMKPSCFTTVTLGENTPRQSFEICRGGDAELKHLLDSARDRVTPGKLDRRRFVNYVIEHGWPSLTQLRFSAYLNDPMSAGMGGPLSEEYLRVIRGQHAPKEFERIFKGAFAAKFVSLR